MVESVANSSKNTVTITNSPIVKSSTYVLYAIKLKMQTLGHLLKIPTGCYSVNPSGNEHLVDDV